MLTLWNSFLGIEEGIISLLLLIDSNIYWAFSHLYNLYIQLAQARIFNTEIISNLVSNIYIIVGVISLFLISYTLLKQMINPDDSSSSKNILGIIKRMLIALLLTVLTPSVFDFLYDFQDSLLTNHVVTKLILQTEDNMITHSIEYTDENGNPIFTSDCTASSLEEAEANCEKLTQDVEIDMATNTLKSYGNTVAYYIMSGFIYPESEDGWNSKNIEVNASEHFNLGHNIKWGLIACGIAGGIATATVVALEIATSPATGFATLAAVPGTIASFGGSILGACGIGAASSLAISGVGYLIDYENYTWYDAQRDMIANGNFNRMTSFATSITGGELHYTPILSTIAGLIILYMMFSFCLDLGVRAVKLLFYQVLAPLCFMISVIPSKKDLIQNWFKLVLTTWLEVFIRIFCVCGVALLIGNFDYESLTSSFGPLATAILILGIVTFAKQLPKLFSQITGIDSGNMKLGIKEKLAEGGAFTAGALIGGGATAFARNAVNAGMNFKNNFEKGADGKWHKKAGVSNVDLFKSGLYGVGSIMAGTASAQFRSGKAGMNAKSFSDMKNAAGKGAKEAVDARENRALYKSRHGGNAVGSMIGHIGDAFDSAGRWAGFDNIEVLLDQQRTIDAIQSERKAIDNESFDIIDGDLAKGKASVSYDSTNAAHLGVTHDMVNLRRLKAELDAAKASGIAADIAAAEVAYSSYRADWADELRNISLKGESNWANVDRAVQADLAKLRIASDKYRETVARNYTANYVNTLNGAADILNRNVDLSVSHAALKDIKDEMKIEQTQITSQINRIRQREQDKKGNGN